MSPAEAIKYIIVPYTRGIVAELGVHAAERMFPHFLSIGTADMPPRQITVADLDVLDELQDGGLDALVHVGELPTIKTLAAWWRTVRVGGNLVLFTQYEAYADMVEAAIWQGEGWVCELREVVEGGYLNVFRKSGNTDIVSAHKYTGGKTACVCRFGGFGDMLQASNILPQLQRDGYHVTIMTTPAGRAILEEDPHIDDWLIQDTDQVPNHLLSEYWKVQATRFDRFINLSESVEGTLLAIPGRANHGWPDAVRRVELNRNYLEWTAQLAELEYANEARFYPTSQEINKVDQYMNAVRAELDGNPPFGVIARPRFFILWALAGSSVHKFYPWQDSVIATIMTQMPEAVVIFTGDTACQILEQGWENEVRVRCESGNMPIRDTLTFAKMADCVVGPETGVLNAVAFETNAKVLMLSHSSHENLSKHWINTAVMEPVDTPCYPCHRLHYGKEFCHTHEETGAAMCQLSIQPELVFDAIRAAYMQWRK